MPQVAVEAPAVKTKRSQAEKRLLTDTTADPKNDKTKPRYWSCLHVMLKV